MMGVALLMKQVIENLSIKAKAMLIHFTVEDVLTVVH